MRQSSLAPLVMLAVTAVAACTPRRAPDDTLVPVTVRPTERSAQAAVLAGGGTGAQLIGGPRQVVLRQVVPATQSASGCRFDERATTARLRGRELELRAATLLPPVPGARTRGVLGVTANPAYDADAATVCTTVADATITGLEPGTYTVRMVGARGPDLGERLAADSVVVTP
jgi:hypothetical protein